MWYPAVPGAFHILQFIQSQTQIPDEKCFVIRVTDTFMTIHTLLFIISRCEYTFFSLNYL